jgi:hypothetical protein
VQPLDPESCNAEKPTAGHDGPLYPVAPPLPCGRRARVAARILQQGASCNINVPSYSLLNRCRTLLLSMFLKGILKGNGHSVKCVGAVLRIDSNKVLNGTVASSLRIVKLLVSA